MQNINSFHIGNIISEHLTKEGRTKTWLASQVCCTKSCLCKMLKKDSISIDYLLRISFACQRNFADDVSAYYNKHSAK